MRAGATRHSTEEHWTGDGHGLVLRAAGPWPGSSTRPVISNKNNKDEASNIDKMHCMHAGIT